MKPFRSALSLIFAWACCLAPLLLLSPLPSSAQEPQIRASMNPQDGAPIYVGQRATLVVELLAPGYFASAAAFHLPDVPGLMLMPPTGSPLVSSETIQDTNYTVQRHEVAVLAHRAGEFAIPAINVRFQFKRQPLDKQSAAASVTTPEVKFTATLPPGAEKAGQIISARGLEVTETWKPEPGTTQAKAGDAFVRTIVFKAPDVPAMMFPPFPAGKIDGLGIYTKPPEVLDKSERGSLTGMRRDVITYACQRPGRFTLPAARLKWFDLESKQVRTIDLPARTFDVAPNPALAARQAATTQASASHPQRGKRLLWGAVSAMLVGLAAYACRRRLHSAALAFLAPLRPRHLQPLNPSPSQPGPVTH